MIVRAERGGTGPSGAECGQTGRSGPEQGRVGLNGAVPGVQMSACHICAACLPFRRAVAGPVQKCSSQRLPSGSLQGAEACPVPLVHARL